MSGKRRVVIAGGLAVAVLLGMTVIQRGAAQSVDRSPAMVAPPAFRFSPGWMTVTTGPTNPAVLPPQVWAITARGNTTALRPVRSFDPLRGLRKDGIVIWATTAGRGAASEVFTPSSWPLRLIVFRVDQSWEGQPSYSVGQRRVRWATVRGWHLDVRVYFGTQHPSQRLLRAAQAELDRMVLPYAG